LNARYSTRNPVYFYTGLKCCTPSRSLNDIRHLSPFLYVCDMGFLSVAFG
jgi:hypothetical protein